MSHLEFKKLEFSQESMEDTKSRSHFLARDVDDYKNSRLKRLVFSLAHNKYFVKQQ